ncbi:hypothetical protein EYZ11_002898 [Aspergillus tanneri]|uniref:Myb-like domain-containing protein n=1 Tax=Aspergillus tanneri TaxID=1220188 RepID=A0A4S3JRP4_9EURO|nr:uncharacterized protein ATNIH1004_011252 [Aspergillus tanneri]KAA8642310.1 hypothetical protein ATNIH1004_011252 [Aspergillus tanneri]THC97608.1 hypothetical protein EYZ11_002898 [Aspergillus tanneri]
MGPSLTLDSAMERPQKRPRLSFAAQEDHDDDNMDLQEARAQNDLRLKSIFEGIFQKYEKDFTEVGDEIDLKTGKIVINNGHIQGMEGEHDTGEREEVAWLFDPDWTAEPDGEDHGATMRQITDYLENENEDTVPGHSETQSQRSPILISSELQPGLDGALQETQDEAINADLDADDDRSSVDSLLDTALDIQNNWNDSVEYRTRIDTNNPATERANTVAKASVQSPSVRADGLPKRVESLWRVPDIKGNFSTPTLNRSQPRLALNSPRRSESPPGARSLWALPWKSRRRTEPSTKKSTKKHKASSQRGRKPHSSPVVYDWSFAETPDGNESDDPLQEDCRPSPTPKAPITIRGKTSGRSALFRTQRQCIYCMQVFSHNDYVAHLKSVLQTNSADDRHEITLVRRQLDAITNEKAAIPQTDVSTHVETHDIPFLHTDTPEVSSNGDAATTQGSTPTGKRIRTVMTPDEVRTIVIMRQVEGKKWKEVSDHFPQKKLAQLIQWNQLHWNDRRANPPQASGPWSQGEREALESLKDQRGLSWSTIRAALPGRSLAELEFELLRLWVGDDVWEGKGALE